MQLEDVLAQLRKEYEMLRIEFEQNLAANEQTGPINREMRHLITSLQNNTQQLKGEVHRYKRKYKEANSEIPKVLLLCFYFWICIDLFLQLRKEIEELTAKLNAQQGAAQDCKDNIKQEIIKEEDNSNTESATQIKEEPNSGVCVKKEGEEDTEVILIYYFSP